MRRPPVIPEIAKAYQNDPRTLLAQAAIANGGSTAPVATGGYAWADGIARALQGVAGGYIAKKTQEKYGAEEAAKVAKMNADGTAHLAPPQPPGPAVGAPVIPPTPPQAAAVAAALGAPAAPAQPPGPTAGPPPIPTAAVPPQAAPQPPEMGGGPMRQRPFGPASASANPLAAPTPEAVPDAPAPVARPVAPEAVGPTRSRLLDEAYKLMAGGDAYDYTRAYDMQDRGLGDQTKLDESAAERKQKLIDMEYDTNSRVYADGANQDRAYGYSERSAAQNRNFEAAQKVGDHQFEHGENSLKMANERTLEGMRSAVSLKVANINAAAKASDPLDPDTISHMAEQALQGDTSVFQNLGGRGAVGARNVLALRKEMYRQGALRGVSPAQIASLNAEFFGRKAEARAVGTRVGSTGVAMAEVPPLAAEALSAHAAVPQSNLVPLNRAMQMYQEGTSSPELARAVVANQAVVNAYARSFGTGQVSDHARKEASDKLNNAWGTPAYASAVTQILRNVKAERAGAEDALSSIGARGRAASGGASAPTGGWGPARVVQ